MTCVQDGHLIHSPSGTRTAVAGACAIGVFTFLNQGIQGNFIRRQKTEDRRQKQEARSKKQEARSKKQEEDRPVRRSHFWLLTNVSAPF
jgi:hypothetical protein